MNGRPSRPGAPLCGSGFGCIRTLAGRIVPGFMLAAVATCVPLSLRAQSMVFNGTAALSSQLVDRGQAITGDTPIVQAAASWTFPSGGVATQALPSGWSLGLSGGATVRSSGRIVETLVQASRYWSVSADWQMQASLLYYRYSGLAGAKALNRAETGLNWSYRDVLTLGVSAIYVLGAEGQHPRAAADITVHWPLTRRFSFSAGAGITQYLMTPYAGYRDAYAAPYDHAYHGRHDRPRADHYSYGHVGLVWSNGPWQVALKRIVTTPQARRLGAYPDASPWVATISRSF